MLLRQRLPNPPRDFSSAGHCTNPHYVMTASELSFWLFLIRTASFFPDARSFYMGYEEELIAGYQT